MSRYSAERLYELLPAVYRQRDAELGFALRDLVVVLAEQAGVAERDIAQLYESWFVETCPDWVVPYIGDLIGVRGLRSERFSGRAEVANTIGYRRRKGTLAVLEQLARDVTGWPARAVEFFELLGTTQYLKHLRPHSLRTPDLRDTNRLELLGGPFETATHTAEVRRLEGGRYNLPNVGLFLWRLTAYPLVAVQPAAADATKLHYFFSSLGRNQLLFIHPATETGPLHIAEEINVPAPIRRRALHEGLKLRAAAIAQGEAVPPEAYYGRGLSLELFIQKKDERSPVAGDLMACDLTDWNRALPPGAIAIDPVLGRLAFAPGTKPAGDLRLTYHYGFSADLGGGQYERQASLSSAGALEPLAVGKDEAFKKIDDALEEWGESGSAVIEVRDSRTYRETLRHCRVPAGARLEIRAINGERPTLRLKLPFVIEGLGEQSRFELNGFLVAGRRLHFAGDLEHAAVRHCTLVPRARPTVVAEARQPEVLLERSIVGKVWTSPGAAVEVRDSVLNAAERDDPVYAGLGGQGRGGPLRISRSTVIGTIATRELTLAENSLLLGPVTAERLQTGCVRFCYVAPGSRLPRRYRCQPADGASAVPRFTSLQYGDPGYCQLALDTPDEIRRGAEDESEMGVFSSLRQPQREDALRARLDEYLRAGLEAGIFYVT